MKRFAITTVGVFGIVLLGLASQAKASITYSTVQTPWPEDSNGISSELNLVPVGYVPGTVGPTTNQKDIMDNLYGYGEWQQLPDQTDFTDPALAVAKFAANTEDVSWVGETGGSGPIANITGGNFIYPTEPYPAQPISTPSSGEHFYLQDVSGGSTWHSYNGTTATNTDDGGVHAVIFQILNQPGVYVVAFEDEATNPLYGPNASGNGDEDYNDAVIELTGATANPAVGEVPEPASLVVWSLLGGLGLAVGVWRRRKAT